MKYTKFFIPFVFILFTWVSCNDCNDNKIKDLDNTAIIFRFDSVFYKINNTQTAFNQLMEIKSMDSVFFNLYLNKVYSMNIEGDLPVELIFKHINSAQNNEIRKRVDSVFGDFSDTRKALDKLSKYYAFYYPQSKFPTIKTFYSGFAGFSAWHYDSLSMMVDLDMYLGENFSAYSLFFPQYKYSFYTPKMLPVNVAKELIRKQMESFEVEKPKNMLAYILIEGAKIYETQKLIPCTPAEDIFEYSKSQLEWNTKEESRIWQYILKEKLLYEADFKIYRPLVGEGPNTIRTGVAEGAPPRIGVWTGFKIIESFFANNKEVANCYEMFRKYKPEDVLAMSKYKP